MKFKLGTYGVLILNRPILIPPHAMKELWNKAAIHSTADGGTDRWFSYVNEHKIDLVNKFPDIVSGDFDSINPDILKMCKEHGSYVETTPDMNNTDFTKSLKVIAAQCKKKLDAVVTIADHSGRLDQIFSNLNTLFKMDEIFQNNDTQCYLLTLSAITWLLRPGTHKIEIPEYLRTNYEWCGILPGASKRNKVTTTGLKWNLDDSQIEFGGLISSSNTYSGEPVVTVTTDTELFWCMSLGAEDNSASPSLKSLLS
ncbi:hypothetical protein AAG570_010160 [Ranatra chinensis]|uniref:Thiamin pyrophosphokinase thiamin-binding domain-containing protein n=1 Tax=Ranatra chinensis TaxID=642074 RepID=A0ABD0Z7W6_9HEMI